MSKLFFRFILIACTWVFGLIPGHENAWAEEHEEKGSAQYYDLKPAFVANFGTSTKKLKFVKANVSIRASSEQAVSMVVMHEPLVRHQIVLLLSRQTEESLSASAGQESVRVEALNLVQEALKKETGSPQIDDLLFTSFVVQR